MLIRAISLSDVVFLINDHWEVPLGLHLGQVFPLGISRFEVPIGGGPRSEIPLGHPKYGIPIGVAPGQGLGCPMALGNPQGLWPLGPP